MKTCPECNQGFQTSKEFLDGVHEQCFVSAMAEFEPIREYDVPEWDGSCDCGACHDCLGLYPDKISTCDDCGKEITKDQAGIWAYELVICLECHKRKPINLLVLNSKEDKR